MTEPAARLSMTYTSPPSADPSRSETGSAIAALAFLEGVSELGTFASLRAWFMGDIIPNRWAPAWEAVHEEGFSAVSLIGRPDAQRLKRLLRAAHDNVVTSLRGLVWSPRDDAWLMGLVHQGLLRFEPSRIDEGAAHRWVACVPPNRALSELVLALLGADILARPDVYDASLCVCSSCGRVTFDPKASGRLGCPLHPVRPPKAGSRRRATTRR